MLKSYSDKILEVQEFLKRAAMTLTRNRDDAMDLTQDTILKLLDSEEKYDEQSKFKNWTLTVMKNLFLNNYRKISRMPIDSSALRVDNISSTIDETPESVFSHKEIVKILSKLPEIYKQPMVMYIEGYSYNEIAEKLCLPLGTVKSRIFKAKRLLKEELEAAGYER